MSLMCRLDLPAYVSTLKLDQKLMGLVVGYVLATRYIVETAQSLSKIREEEGAMVGTHRQIFGSVPAANTTGDWLSI